MNQKQPQEGLQDGNKFLKWTKKIKLNEMKSMYVYFMKRKLIPHRGFWTTTLDAKLLWNTHINKKRTEFKAQKQAILFANRKRLKITNRE